MSTEILNELQRWGMPRLLWRNTGKLRNRQFDTPYWTDCPERCNLGSNYWRQYTYRNYQYKFNDWGFRNNDNFEQYRKEVYADKVNVCIGDSFSINVGGPQEHAWPQQLSKKLQIPTLNLAIDGLSVFHYRSLVDKCKELFNVNQVFVLYNLFEDTDREELNRTNVMSSIISDYNAKFLKKHCWVYDAYWQFDPPWTFDKDELQCLYEHFPEAHNYLKTIQTNFSDVDINLLLEIDALRNKYYEMAGSSWISYEKFCETVLIGINVLDYFSTSVDKHLINEFLSAHFVPTTKQMLLTNRDGRHLSLMVNQALADYFYQQTLKSY
jgi:hypothetical protein